MYSHEYFKEIASPKTEKQIPTVVALILIAVVAVACWFGYQSAKAHDPANQPVAQVK